MKTTFTRFLKHPLISGSAVIFTGSLIASVFNALYHAFMVRNLTPADYGALASFISIIMLFSLAASALTPAIIHYAASYFAQHELGKVKSLFVKVNILTIGVGLLLWFIFTLFSEPLSNFFHLTHPGYMIYIGFVICLSFLGVVNVALLQARLQFSYLTFTNLAGAILKLLCGILFVLLGFSLLGALWAFVLSFFVPYVLTFLPLRFLFDKSHQKKIISLREIVRYGAPAALAMLSLAAFINMDIILVKHYFDPTTAGIYAGLSFLGKVIFYFSSPISSVMFPLIVQKHAKQENYRNSFYLALLLVLIPSLGLTMLYALFPQVVLEFLKRKEYLSFTQLITLFALYISLYAVLSVVTNFYLSIKKTVIAIPLAVGALMQIGCIALFHNSLIQVLLLSMGITFLLLLCLLLYYPHATKK